MTKAEYIRQMTDEQLVDMCDNYEEQIVLPSCNDKYCEYSTGNGSCEGVSQGKCRFAIKNWLQSPVEEGKPWYE